MTIDICCSIFGLVGALRELFINCPSGFNMNKKKEQEKRTCIYDTVGFVIS